VSKRLLTAKASRGRNQEKGDESRKGTSDPEVKPGQNKRMSGRKSGGGEGLHPKKERDRGGEGQTKQGSQGGRGGSRLCSVYAGTVAGASACSIRRAGEKGHE